MDTNEVTQLIADKEKQLVLALQSQEAVDQEEISLSKKILELRIRKKDIENAQSKARHNVKMLQLEIKNLTNKYWSMKNQGA